jgi:hypothetical protein
MTHLSKLIVAGIDGSEDALKALDYLGLIYGAKHNLEVEVLYVLPALPQILVADRERTTKMRLLDVDKKSIQLSPAHSRRGKNRSAQKRFQRRTNQGISSEKAFWYSSRYLQLRRREGCGCTTCYQERKKPA